MGNINSDNLFWQPEKEKEPILNKVSLNFEEGGFYAIIGPNGSGKTSFLRHVMRFLKVESGTLSINGMQIEEYNRLHLAKEIALVPQNTQIDSAFSVYDIVMMGRNPHQKRFDGITQKDIAKVEEAMKLASCDGFESKKITNLSGGEAQRVVVARAIAQDTPWLLLDEPVSNLDLRHQKELMETLKLLNEQSNVSMIVVLHDINLAANYCSHIVMMKNGKVYFSGKTKEAMTTERLEEVYEIPFVSAAHPVSKMNYYIPL